jgi:hypothetical protein
MHPRAQMSIALIIERLSTALPCQRAGSLQILPERRDL